MKRRQRGRAGGLALAALLLLLITALGCMGGSTSASRQGARTVAGSKAAVIPPMGVLYSHVSAPAFSVPPRDLGSKRGEATSMGIAVPPLPFPGLSTGVPLLGWGDSSAEASARNGGITNVKHADYEVTVILMVFRKFTMVTYGD